MGTYQTFIVRIWADEDTATARGQIQHVASRRSSYFQDAHRLLRFIDEYLGPYAIHLTHPRGQLRPPGDTTNDSRSVDLTWPEPSRDAGPPVDPDPAESPSGG